MNTWTLIFVIWGFGSLFMAGAVAASDSKKEFWECFGIIFMSWFAMGMMMTFILETVEKKDVKKSDF